MSRMGALDIEQAASLSIRPKQTAPELLMFLRMHPLLAPALVLAVLLIAGGDLLEIVPAAKPWLRTSWFRYFHEVHDILALALTLMAAHRWHPSVGRALIGFYFFAHLPYAYLTFPEEFAEHLSLILQASLGLGAIYLIARLNKAADEVKEAAGVSHHLARHDALTDLPNRTAFNEKAREAMERAKCRGSCFAILYLDLDHFKDINDSLGHGLGDEVLVAVSERLRENIHHCDMVARLGGDEFAIIATELPAAEDAAFMATRLIEAVSRPILISGQEINVTPSIGIAPFPLNCDGEQVTDPWQLLGCADMAMYRAKANGRNTYEFYDRQMSIQVQNRMALVSDLRHACERDQLVLYYQPMVDVRTGEIVGAEALLRWDHPTKGIILPMDFIPGAEASGLILSIGSWVLRKACAQARAWQEAGLPRIRIGVNLSPVQLKRQKIAETVAHALSNTGLDACLLDLELTESILMRDLRYSEAALRELRELGISLSIDDFGTGYSSLSYLKEFHVDTLKIARIFVQDVDKGGDAGVIAEAIINLGHSLGMTVLAEGVETQAQLNHLRILGCDLAQGYYFSKPVPAEEFIKQLKKNSEGSKKPPGMTIEFY